MHFVIFATDRPDHEKVRDGEQPRHHAYIHDPGLPVRVQVAGPTLDPDRETINGSLFIIDAEGMAAAEAFVAGDPYNQAGLFETVVIRAFHWGRGRVAYNLANFLRTLATPDGIGTWSLTSLRERLIKTGARLVRHARYAVFQFAEAALPRQIFAGLLARINGLRAPPAKAACA